MNDRHHGTPSASTSSDPRSVAVVIPMPSDPDWSIFEELSEEIPVIVVDDSDGNLAPPPRANVRYFDYAAQKEVMGRHYDAQPHKSAATRNMGHYLAYQEGYDVIIALDYDCRTRSGWLDAHLATLAEVVDAPAVRGAWVNTVEQPGFFARGYPYELRNEIDAATTDAAATGSVKLNIGVWDHILDLNGVDKLQNEPPYDPGLRGDRNHVALGNIPVCGMNTAFTRDLTPAYFFLPDVWIDGWKLTRHDDIWGGYVLKRLMDIRGDLVAYGRPVVEHTRQTPLERVVVSEHWMHLMSMPFYDIVDDAARAVSAGTYAEMFGSFVDEYRRRVDRASVPVHYRRVYAELGEWMQRWALAFT